jgi:predicted nucleic acid-binding Zn ribbon protein
MARRDSYGKCPVKWYIDDLGKKKWVCSQHLAPYRHHPETSEKCWYSTCPGRSMCGYPLTQEELNERKGKQALEKIREVESNPTPTCENYECSKSVASNRKKYCSDKCRMQKSRADYEARNPNRSRKKSEKKKQQPATPPQPVPPEIKQASDICSSIICSNKIPPTRKAYCSDPCRKRAYVQRKRGLTD